MGSRLFKKALKGYCKKYKRSYNYKEIQEALENVCKHIDDRNKEKFDKWMAKLNYETKLRADESLPEIKELRKKQKKAQKKIKEKAGL